MNPKRDKVFWRAINVLAYRMRTVKEMSDKLMEKCDDEEIVNDVLFELCQKKLLDDKNYAELYVEESINLKNKGQFRISAELVAKGVEKSVISRAISAFAEAEYAALLNYIESYTRGRTFESYADIEKLKAHLYRRGYAMSDINSAVRESEISWEE